MESTCPIDPNESRVRRAVLFTDLEGSTKWLYEMGPAVVFRALEEHFKILKTEFSNFGGETVKRNGDGIMAVFSTIEDAIRSAVQIQNELMKARTDRVRPLRIPSMRVGISAGEAYCYNVPDVGVDYFGKVCAEASRILDLTEGNHILVGAEALSQEEFGRDALISDGLKFTKVIRVFRKGLDEVPVCEVLYQPHKENRTELKTFPKTDENGFIQRQLISRSRPDISPFSYFESSEKAESDIDEFLLNSTTFDFLHIRGIVAGSSSPFNRFIKLVADGRFDHGIELVRIGILSPESDWLRKYYLQERSLDENVTSSRINECKTAIDIAKIKLERFSSEGLIKNWKIFLYEQDPIWRLAITRNGVIATPYGGPGRTVNSIVLFAESNNDPIYHSFKRFFDVTESTSEKFASDNLQQYIPDSK